MQNKSYVQPIMITLLLWVVLFLLLSKSCRRKVEVPAPYPVETVRTVITHDTTAYGAIRDSLTGIIATLDNSIDRNEKALQSARNKATQLEKDNDILLASLNSDSLPERLRQQALAMKIAARRKDSLCNSIASGLRGKVAAKDKQLTASVALGKKLNTMLDSCLYHAKKVDKFIKPRNKVAIGVVFNVFPSLGYGVSADLIHKSGYVFGATVMQLNGSTHFAIGVKRVL